MGCISARWINLILRARLKLQRSDIASERSSQASRRMSALIALNLHVVAPASATQLKHPRWAARRRDCWSRTTRRFDRAAIARCGPATLAGAFGLDRRQIVNLTVVALSPTFTNRILRARRERGWTLAGSWRANTGGATLTPTYSD